MKLAWLQPQVRSPLLGGCALFGMIVAGQGFGFDPTTVLGAGNLKSITGGFDAIAQMGAAMLAGGADAASVAAAIQKAADDLAAKAAGLGFDPTAVAGVQFDPQPRGSSSVLQGRVGKSSGQPSVGTSAARQEHHAEPSLRHLLRRHLCQGWMLV